MILVDTHVLAWLAFEPDRVSRKARAAIDDARRDRDGMAISDITLWELAMLFGRGRVRLEVSLESFLREVETKFVVLPITARTAVGILALPSNYPKDPADRVIGATALVEGLPLITGDREIRRSGALRTIW